MNARIRTLVLSVLFVLPLGSLAMPMHPSDIDSSYWPSWIGRLAEGDSLRAHRYAGLPPHIVQTGSSSNTRRSLDPTQVIVADQRGWPLWIGRDQSSMADDPRNVDKRDMVHGLPRTKVYR